jgi:hypothetical protein
MCQKMDDRYTDRDLFPSTAAELPETLPVERST